MTATETTPLGRAPAECVAEDYANFKREPLMTELLNGFLEPAMVLNDSRQVVFANDKMLKAVGKSASEVIGFRPGELFGCIHAWEHETGCGTSRFCTQCGGGQTILAATTGRQSCTAECSVTCGSASGGTQAVELRVIGTPVRYQGRDFTVFAIRDITDEKRRAVLERLFFHDILNAAGGLRGLLELWPDTPPEEQNELLATATGLADELIEEVRSYRDLAMAERRDLRCVLKNFDVRPLLHRLHTLYRNHKLAEGKSFPAPEVLGPTVVHSDEVLLQRVLVNLLKNAFEAASANQAVRLTFNGFDEPTISVHNEGCMPIEVQLQVFQRSFSTKAESGRGLGTYSVKLLTEQYLGGAVTFDSTEHGGTNFHVRVPRARASG